MSNRKLKLQVLMAVCLASSLGSAFGSQDISFKKSVLPVFQRICVACHNTGEEQGNLGLAPALAYKNLVGAVSRQVDMPKVTPGDPQRSYLLHKLKGSHLDAGGSGTRMPMGFDPLPDSDIDMIEAWVQAGARNN